ncbi:MAG: hypothetical protein JKY92_05515 [Magnetovibrio sp.]|nr:hypothetical protein [Magnetovibrio sp.]
MRAILKLRRALSANINSNPEDVLAAKTFLQNQGLYKAPDWGISEFPDRALFKAIEAFQKNNNLRVDGIMKPKGETEAATQFIQAQALKLQSMGRNGDTILAHITLGEARLLKEKGGAGTVNPKTGLLEFSKVSKKKGKYIWHTVGDGKVRSSHEDRDGKEFSWDEPPGGGHPGEAYNCRCSAEDIVDKQRCKELDRLIKVMEINLKKADERYSKAADIFNAAQKALKQRENKCLAQLRKSGATVILDGAAGGALGAIGGLPGVAVGTARGAGIAVIKEASAVYEACIVNVANSQEKVDFEKAQEDLKKAIFWVKAHREDLTAYRDEYEQLGCKN